MKKLNKINKFIWIIYWVVTIISIVWMWNLIIMNKSVYIRTSPKIFLNLLVTEIGIAVVFALFMSVLQDIYFISYSRKNLWHEFIPANEMLILLLIVEVAKRYVEWRFLLEQDGKIGIIVIGIISYGVILFFTLKSSFKELLKVKKVKHIDLKYDIIFQSNGDDEILNVFNLKFVFFENNTEDESKVISSFDLRYKENSNISKDIFYIDYKNDLPILKRKNKKIYEEILNNMAVFLRVTDNENETIDDLMQYCQEEGLSDKQGLIVFATNNKEIPSSDYYLLMDYVKICGENEYIETIEKALRKNITYEALRDQRFYTMPKLQRLIYKFFGSNDLQGDTENIISKDTMNDYNKRFSLKFKHMPQAPLLQTMYKNAFAQDSAQRSYLVLLNYINCLNQIMSYYVYLKNKKASREIDVEIIRDDYDTYAKTFKMYLNNKNERLYKRIKVNQYDIYWDLNRIVKHFFSKIVDNEFVGEKITYYGAIELIGKIRDKAHAHGNVDEKDVFIYWKLIYEVSRLFNEIFEVEKLHIETEGKKVYIYYEDEKEKVDMGDYIIANNDIDMFIVQSASKRGIDMDYVNYLAGRYIRPLIKNVENVDKEEN